MDIEGAEYDVIDDILNSNIRIHQILVELHHRFPGNINRKDKKIFEKIIPLSRSPNFQKAAKNIFFKIY